MSRCLILLCLHIVDSVVRSETSTNYTFPPGFLFGAATASYQVEGAWNVDGKGLNVWDEFTHAHPEYITDHSTGDDAAKSYYKYKEDIKALKEMGMQFYRFSISWTRIMPTGLPNYINQKGIDYYNNIINELISNGILPLVTMYHWDLPAYLQHLGGWTSDAMVTYFENYADVLYSNFGDRVKWWVTLNEPSSHAEGYELPEFAPGTNTSGLGFYLSSHNMIKAHARAYRLYDSKYRKQQQGRVSLTIPIIWAEPHNLTSSSDKEAAERILQLAAGLYCHPIFSKEGDYPQLIKDMVAKNSIAQGFLKSRLPEFTPEEIEYVRGSADFFALNEYTTVLVSQAQPKPSLSYLNDIQVDIYIPVQWIESNTSKWLTIAPKSVRRILQWIMKEYGPDWEVFITENGYADAGTLNDTTRITYLATYMSEMLEAMSIDNCKVIGYTIWSLIDNYEWVMGYTSKFGLYHVDFNDPERPRTPKKSSYFMADVIKTRKISPNYLTLAEKIDAEEDSSPFRVKVMGMGLFDTQQKRSFSTM